MRGKPRPAKSYTGGEKSSLPLNHGFTVCWSAETTSVRWPGMSERTWLASTWSVRAPPAARWSVRRRRGPRLGAATRPPRHVADFLVGQPLELSQHDDLAEFARQPVDRVPHRCARRLPEQHRFRMDVRHGFAV